MDSLHATIEEFPADLVPIRSWKRFLQLKTGVSEIVILSAPEPTKIRLAAEIEGKKKKKKK